MKRTKNDYPRCPICGGSILYLGALVCSPDCWRRFVAQKAEEGEPDPFEL